MIRRLLAKFGYHQVDWCASMGRYHLMVNGYVVATQTDKCRDSDLLDDMHQREDATTWDKEMLLLVLGERAALCHSGGAEQGAAP